MKIFVLAPKENWICDRIAEEWKSQNNSSLAKDPDSADVIWLLAGWCWNHIKPEILKNKKTIVTIHHIVPEKFDTLKQQEFLIRDQFVDAYHVPNNITAQLVSQLTKKPIFVIGYWYDDSFWKASMTKSQARDFLNLNQSDFIIGSFQRDSEGKTGLPKLEKGPDIFCSAVEKYQTIVDKNVHVLLGGWRRHYVENKLKEKQVQYTLKELVEIETLKAMYIACDLYLVTSRFEGGPQAILEASALKTPILSRNVGMASLVLSPYSVLDFPEQICLPTLASIEYNFESVKRFALSSHSKNYTDMFARILK